MAQLDQALVTRYAKASALKTRLEDWLKETRKLLLEQFHQGYTCPQNGPYLLALGDGGKQHVNWKQEFWDYVLAVNLFKYHGDHEKAAFQTELDVKEIEARERPHTERLSPKVNPNFRRASAVRI